jgi:hypothetical protein
MTNTRYVGKKAFDVWYIGVHAAYKALGGVRPRCPLIGRRNDSVRGRTVFPRPWRGEMPALNQWRIGTFEPIVCDVYGDVKITERARFQRVPNCCIW